MKHQFARCTLILMLFTGLPCLGADVPVFFGLASLDEDDIIKARPAAIELLQLASEYHNIEGILTQDPGNHDNSARKRRQAKLGDIGMKPYNRVEPLFLEVERQLPSIVFVLICSGCIRRQILRDIVDVAIPEG